MAKPAQPLGPPLRDQAGGITPRGNGTADVGMVPITSATSEGIKCFPKR